VMTGAGPEPLETWQSGIDYDHYLTRQLQPIADAILPLLGTAFETLISGQHELF
jgi:DNA polymerase II